MFTIRESKKGSLISLKLSGELTIYTAAQARGELQARLEKHKNLELDLWGVEELDTAGVQVLLWAKREAKNRGRALPFVNQSSLVIEIFDLLKVTGIFGDPILIAPDAS
jgi:anti-sigma B factor antagonist